MKFIAVHSNLDYNKGALTMVNPRYIVTIFEDKQGTNIVMNEGASNGYILVVQETMGKLLKDLRKVN